MWRTLFSEKLVKFEQFVSFQSSKGARPPEKKSLYGISFRMSVLFLGNTLQKHQLHFTKYRNYELRKTLFKKIYHFNALRSFSAKI